VGHNKLYLHQLDHIEQQVGPHLDHVLAAVLGRLRSLERRNLTISWTTRNQRSDSAERYAIPTRRIRPDKIAG